MDNNFEKLKALAEWTRKSGYSMTAVSTELILWAADRVELLESIIGEDVDLDGPLSDPQPHEPISEERE